jgi:hypothetical protein
MSGSRGHYVVQFQLRWFSSTPLAADAEKKIWVFDLYERQWQEEEIESTAQEREFYGSLERQLSKNETKFARCLGELLSNPSSPTLIKNKKKIASFIALQMMRTPLSRLKYEIATDIADELRQHFGIPMPQHLPDRVKNGHLAAISMPEIRGKLHAKLCRMQWLLVRNTSEHPFWLSDNPVVAYSPSRSPGDSYASIDGADIEIYVPLAPSLAVMVAHDRRIYPDGGVVQAAEEDVRFMNDLQVDQALCAVFSPTPDFGLAGRMTVGLSLLGARGLQGPQAL